MVYLTIALFARFRVNGNVFDIQSHSVLVLVVLLVFLKSTQNPLSINDLSIRGYENAKKCSLIDPYYVKKTPCFQYKIKSSIKWVFHRYFVLMLLGLEELENIRSCKMCVRLFSRSQWS